MKKTNTVKRYAALMMASGLAMGTWACGGSAGTQSTGAPETTKAETAASQQEKQETEAVKSSEAEEKAADTAITEPIEITLWGKWGAGVNGDTTRALVDKFNAENGKGIKVLYEHAGNTATIMSEIMTAVAGGTTPELIMMDCTTVPILAENGVLADVSKYVERDNFDPDNIIENMNYYSTYGDAYISIPFARSNVVYIYNPDIFEECGVTVPVTIDEMVENAKIIKEKKGIPSYSMIFDASFYQNALLVGMGSEGVVSEDGKRPAALEDGCLERLLTDWQTWVKEGWCTAPDVTDAEKLMLESFYQGKLAAFETSSGLIRTISKAVEETGQKAEVAFLPGYNGNASGSGGSQIGVIAPGKTDAQIEASWEFMKFMLEDENVVYFTENTGFLPTTKSSLETDGMKKVFEEYPGIKTAIDQMPLAADPYWSTHRADWQVQVRQAMSAVIQDGADVSDQIAYLESQKQNVFGN